MAIPFIPPFANSLRSGQGFELRFGSYGVLKIIIMESASEWNQHLPDNNVWSRNTADPIVTCISCLRSVNSESLFDKLACQQSVTYRYFTIVERRIKCRARIYRYVSSPLSSPCLPSTPLRPRRRISISRRPPRTSPMLH